MMDRWRWTCTVCQASGIVFTEPTAAAYVVLFDVESDHRSESHDHSHYDHDKVEVEPLDEPVDRGGPFLRKLAEGWTIDSTGTLNPPESVAARRARRASASDEQDARP